MATVVPWPGSLQDPGYINLQNSYVDRKTPDGKVPSGKSRKYPVSDGKPFRDVGQLVSRAAWINTTTQFKDVWYCLSLQSTAKPDPHNPGKLKAVRRAANAVAVKALWIDMDVGEGPKKYPAVEDALKTIIEFRERVGLPPFSAIVFSGSGIHVYWISDVALTPTEWAPYAHGLKSLLISEGIRCDAGLTTDIARILRVPGTFNWKTDQPQPVQLGNVPLVVYNFESTIKFLTEIDPQTSVTPGGTAPNVYFDAAAAELFKRTPVFKLAGPDLQEGIDKYDETLLKIEPIFKQCGFYKEALLTGGANYDQTLWMYSVLGTTFMENGNAIAHAISQGHATYTQDDTQALYDRKVAERHDRGIGYPSCSTIAAAGCEACKTCPLLPKGKSPLNIRPSVTATVTARQQPMTPQTRGAQDLMLPVGYDLDPEGFICKVVEIEQEGELLPPTYQRLFLSRLSDPWVQSEPDCLNFTTTVDKGRVHPASIKHEEMQGSVSVSSVLGHNRVKTFPDNKRLLEHFMVSWLAKLHETASAQQALPFGWYREDGEIKGFVFAGRMMLDNGNTLPCGVGDAKLRTIFHPSGDINHWYDACETITNQKRPELDAIIALSFAAPLTALIGKNAMTLCAYGDSGVGKTAAYSVGVSVWGHSKKGKAVSHSTFNSVMKKMGELSNLPLYWDEIKDVKAQRAVLDFIYNATDGVEKDRLKSDTSMQERGSWQTQMMMAANISFVDFVMKEAPSHVAGISRVLEYNVKKSTSPVGRISQTDADVIFNKLTSSYGQIGLLYAEKLAHNHAAIKQECIDTCKMVELDMKNTEEERLWVAQVGTLLVAARLANELGCKFDLEALKSFLYRVYLDNREKRNSMMSVSGHRDTTEGVMTSYFDQVQVNDQALWTDQMPADVPGQPPTSMIVHQPKDARNVSVTTSIACRWATHGRALYIDREHLVAYLSDADVGVSTTLDSLRRDYGMTMKRMKIGSGTTFITGRKQCCIFRNIGPDHDWVDMLYKWTPPNERPKDDGPMHPIETGLTPVEDVVEFVKGATSGP